MNKYLSKFWIAPVFTILIFVVSYIIYFVFFLNNANEYTKDFGIVDCGGYVLYAALLIYFGRHRKLFISGPEIKTYFILIALTIAAVLREAGAQKWLPSQDTTMIKVRFFTNPDNPFFEKLISGAVILFLTGLLIYLIVHWSLPIIKGFFNKNPLAWTIVTLCADGTSSKIIDRLPATLRELNLTAGAEVRDLLLVFEETGEFLLPALSLIALAQFKISRQHKERA